MMNHQNIAFVISHNHNVKFSSEYYLYIHAKQSKLNYQNGHDDHVYHVNHLIILVIYI